MGTNDTGRRSESSLSRRDFLKSAALPLMEAFEASSAIEDKKHQALDRNFIHTNSDILTLSGLRELLPAELANKCRNLHYFLRFDSVGRLALSSGCVVDQIGKILSQDTQGYYPNVAPSIRRKLSDFFDNPALDRRWPGFVFVMPSGYVTSKHHFGIRKSLPKNRKLRNGDVQLVQEGRCALSLGKLWREFDIPIDLKTFPLLVPDGRPSKWARPVVRRRIRDIVHADGTRSMELLTQIGCAAPDDVERFIKQDLYYPGSHGCQMLGPDGKSCFTKNTTVIVLARLVPSVSFLDARIHQLSMALPASLEGIRDCNYLIRGMNEFTLNYTGLDELIRRGSYLRQ